MGRVKKTYQARVSEDTEKLKLSDIYWKEGKLIQPSIEASFGGAEELNTSGLRQSAFLPIFPRSMKTCVHTHICMNVYGTLQQP